MPPLSDPFMGRSRIPFMGRKWNLCMGTIGVDDLRGEEQELCALGWLKLCPLEADGNFVMCVADDLSLVR